MDKPLILIVDDTPENIDLLSNILRNEYEIKAAPRGEKALQIAGSSPRPDMILLDIMMPDIDGYEVCRRLKQDADTRHIPVIFVTAKDGIVDEKLGFDLGAVDYITKPFSPPIVMSRVKTHLQLFNQNQMLAEQVVTQAEEMNRSRSDLTRIEKEIWNSREQFEKIFNNHPDAILILNLEPVPRILQCNEAAQTIFGYTQTQIVGKIISEMHVNEQYYRRMKSNVYTALEKGTNIQDYKFQMKKKDGSIFSTEHTIFPLKDNIGELSGWVTIIKETTRREQQEKKMQQLQKMESIGHLAAGIAHDFNNILFPIIGFSEILLSYLEKSSKEYQSIQKILTAGLRGKDLVRQILAFSRQSDQKLLPVRIQQIFKEVLKLMRASIPSNIDIIQDFQPDCGQVLADATQMHQIGMNLMTNAYHSVQEQAQGRITISLKEVELNKKQCDHMHLKPGWFARLSVSDNGVGISPENLSKIFEPYFTTKQEGKGTGLGLAMVYGIVKKSRGDIKVTSSPGKGTQFSLYFPLESRSDDPEPIKTQQPAPRGSERILLVDDEADISTMLTNMLKRLGYSVTAHNSSSEALEMFRKNQDQYDLVISDMSMPEMTGIELGKEILSIRPSIPVILCTGFGDKDSEKQALDAGIRSILTKPVSRSEMAKTVRQVLDEFKF